MSNVTVTATTLFSLWNDFTSTSDNSIRIKSIFLFQALHYVVEILPEREKGARGEIFEPAYSCELCCVTTQGIPMFAHLTGNKHRYSQNANIQNLFN